jgi:cytosine/adenosine deaminase-related metal-dependent hydrolase
MCEPWKANHVRDIQSYHVAWFITGDARPDVTVRIGEGRLLSVEPGRSADAIELGAVALISGLVNAHTHLEFSGMTQPIPTTGRFTDWIRAVVAHRRAHPTAVGDAIRSGIRESIESGTTLLGDIATSGWSWSDYSASGLNGVVFQEILGLLPDRVVQQKEVARLHLRESGAGHATSVTIGMDEESPHPNPRRIGTQTPLSARPGRGDRNCTKRIEAGVSPHAPYSTHLELVRDAVDLAAETGCPLAMHLAETRQELELLSAGTGDFREMLLEFGLWRDEPSRFGRRPLDYLERLAKAPRLLVIHGNYLEEDELRFLATQPQMTLVYCPRTHAAFGHPTHPWRRARELGVRVALGTDSRASNPDLSVFAELQFLAAMNPDISHLDLLQMGSVEGRLALGFDESNDANLTLVRLADSSMNRPEQELFSLKHRVCGTMINGRWSWLEPDLTTHHLPN